MLRSLRMMNIALLTCSSGAMCCMKKSLSWESVLLVNRAVRSLVGVSEGLVVSARASITESASFLVLE